MVQVTKILNTTLIHVLDAAAFTGIGYLTGHTINHIMGSFKPSFLPKTPYLNVLSGTVCCSIFIIIDQIARAILSLKDVSNMPPAFKAQFTLFRMIGSASAAIALTNVLPLNWGVNRITWQAALTLLGVATLAYTILITQVNGYNERLPRLSI